MIKADMVRLSATLFMCAVEMAAVQLLSLWSTFYLQEYMDLGPAFLEHVAGLRMHGGPVAVAKLTSALYFYTDQDYLRDVDPPEMLALLQATSALVRRCEFCAFITSQPHPMR